MRTKEDYIKEKIVEATKHLKTLPHCPSCHKSVEDNVIGRRQTQAMDIDLIYCHHPYHSLRYDDGSDEMVALGLPNHPNFDKVWISDMQVAAHRYALSIK